MNRVQHFLIPVEDMDRARKFYQQLFSWDITSTREMHSTYKRAETVDEDKPRDPDDLSGINGGLFPKGEYGMNDVVIVVDVDSINPILDKVSEAGCRVVLPKTSVSEHGYFAGMTDSEGNVVGLWEKKLAKRAEA